MVRDGDGDPEDLDAVASDALISSLSFEGVLSTPSWCLVLVAGGDDLFGCWLV